MNKDRDIRQHNMETLMNEKRILDYDMFMYTTRKWMQFFLKVHHIKYRVSDSKYVLWSLIVQNAKSSPRFWDNLPKDKEIKPFEIKKHAHAKVQTLDARNLQMRGESKKAEDPLFWDTLTKPKSSQNTTKNTTQKSSKIAKQTDSKVDSTMKKHTKAKVQTLDAKNSQMRGISKSGENLLSKKSAKFAKPQTESKVELLDVSPMISKDVEKSAKHANVRHKVTKMEQLEKQLQYYLDELYEKELNELNQTEYREEDITAFVDHIWEDVGEALKESQLNPGSEYLRKLARDIVTIEFEDYDVSKKEFENEFDRILFYWKDILQNIVETKYNERIDEMEEKYKHEQTEQENIKENLDFVPYNFSQQEEEFYNELLSLANRAPNLITFFVYAQKIITKFKDVFSASRFARPLVIDALVQRGYDKKDAEGGLEDLLKLMNNM